MNYDELVGKIKEVMSAFITEAEMGKEGKGSKAHSLVARKLSLQATSSLKDFRKVSLDNDKTKVSTRKSCKEDPVVDAESIEQIM